MWYDACEYLEKCAIFVPHGNFKINVCMLMYYNFFQIYSLIEFQSHFYSENDSYFSFATDITI